MEIQVIEIAKSYKDREKEVVVLKDITCNIGSGSTICFVGNSGSGKTTLLNILSGIIMPSMGKVLLDGRDINEYLENDQLRRKYVGYLDQYPERNLFLDLSIDDNLKLLLLEYGIERSRWSEIISSTLKRVNLSYLSLDTRCAVLSGGELQRLGLGLSLLNDPKIIIADEPTGNVDFKNANEILSLLKSLAINEGKTVIIASHDPLIQRYSDRTYMLSDGRISSIYEQGEKIPYVHTGEMVSLPLTKGGTITLPEMFLEKLPRRKIVTAEIQGTDVILHFGEGERNDE